MCAHDVFSPSDTGRAAVRSERRQALHPGGSTGIGMPRKAVERSRSISSLPCVRPPPKRRFRPAPEQNKRNPAPGSMSRAGLTYAESPRQDVSPGGCTATLRGQLTVRATVTRPSAFGHGFEVREKFGRQHPTPPTLRHDAGPLPGAIARLLHPDRVDAGSLLHAAEHQSAPRRRV
jgi:hypothetical protein